MMAGNTKNIPSKLSSTDDKVTVKGEGGKQDHEKISLLPSSDQKLSSAIPPPPSLSTLLFWADLPDWMRDNHYIHSGYRAPSNSWRGSASSVWTLHNESVNIWTHLIGAVLAVLVAVCLTVVLKPRYALATRDDMLVLACFFGGAAGCLGMSATYHTLSNHSEHVARLGNRLDYVGIVLLIWGSFIPSVYYGFAAETALVKLYWTMITTIAAGTLVVVLYPKFRTPAWRPFRAFMFVSMGLSAVVPVLHGLRLYGLAQLERQIGLSWLVLQGALYIIGASIYAARIPERWRPGAFDIWGSSHQIFHVLVLLAAAAHLVGLLKAFDYEHRYRSGIMNSYDRLRNLGRAPW